LSDEIIDITFKFSLNWLYRKPFYTFKLHTHINYETLNLTKFKNGKNLKI